MRSSKVPTHQGAGSMGSRCDRAVQELIGLGASPGPDSVREVLSGSFGGAGPDGRATTQLLIGLARVGRASVAAIVMECLAACGAELNLFHYGAVLNGHARLGQWARALQLLSTMMRRRVEMDTVACSVALSACEKGGEWTRALGLLSLMVCGSIEIDTIAYSAAISACEKSGEWTKALFLLSELEQRGVQVDVISYSAAISACEKGGEWTKALLLLSSMVHRSLEMGVITYNAAISACEKNGEWARALDLLRAMAQGSIEVDAITLSAAVSACKAGDEWTTALELLSALVHRSVEMNTIAYSAAVSACEKGSAWMNALELSCQMMACSMEKDSSVLNTAVAACKHQLPSTRDEGFDSFLAVNRVDGMHGAWSAAIWLLDVRLAEQAGAGRTDRHRLRRAPLAPRGFLAHLYGLGVVGLTLRRFLRACSRPKRTSFRINSLKAQPDLIDQLRARGWSVSPVPWQKDGLFLEAAPAEEVLGLARPRLTGQIYFQESTSMIPAQVLQAAICAIMDNQDAKRLKHNIGDGDGDSNGSGSRLAGRLRVLDACAAPGSKTTQLGSWLSSEMGGGVLFANEPDKRRAAKLRANVIRSGLADCVVTCMDGRVLGDLAPEQFDAVLVDVPCSCEGNARKDWFALLGVGPDFEVANGDVPASVKALVELQFDLIRSGWRALRPGGCLVYSTCTFNRWENEMQCERFLDSCNAKSADVSQMLGMPPELAGEFGTLRLWPQDFNTEGFFVACFFKEAPAPAAAVLDPIPLARTAEAGTQLKTLSSSEVALLRERALQELGFWPGNESEQEDQLLCEGVDGQVWLVPNVGQGLHRLAAHSSEPGLLIAHVRRTGGHVDFELSDEFYLFSGDRAEGPATRSWTPDKWAELCFRVAGSVT